ncbi:MAG: hypothetical protein OXC01_21640 [Immundisolibacterales bacterium]|nr:hypothetical protein [Immundisolibacterales bacterium]
MDVGARRGVVPTLIGDLLDTGRIEAGTLSVAPERSEVAALVDRARSTFLSGGARHSVLIDLPGDLPPVMANRRRIVQGLNNLLANAARHPQEPAPIRASRAAIASAIQFSVANSLQYARKRHYFDHKEYAQFTRNPRE